MKNWQDGNFKHMFKKIAKKTSKSFQNSPKVAKNCMKLKEKKDERNAKSCHGLSKDAKSWQRWPKVDKSCQKLMTVAIRFQILSKFDKIGQKNEKGCQKIEKISNMITWWHDIMMK